MAATPLRVIEGNGMDKSKALDAALSQIERAFGKGSIMRLGAERGAGRDRDRFRPGSLGLDIALGIGGVPRGRVVEIYGPEIVGQDDAGAARRRRGAEGAAASAASSMPNMRSMPAYARKLGVKIDDLLISQPDTGEQALEIADTLVRSGAVDVLVIDSVAALMPRAEIEGEMGDQHLGLQARLMSQALRKLTGSIIALQHHA